MVYCTNHGKKGRKILTLKEIKSQLDKPDGNRLNYIAPANGLTLWKVKY